MKLRNETHRPSSRRLPVLAVLLALPAGACTALLPQLMGAHEVVPNTGPTEVTRRAAETFRHHDIPVDRMIPDYGVSSGEFVVGPVWGGAPVEHRVDCGIDHDGRPRARGAEIALTVDARVRDHRETTLTGAQKAGTVVYLDSSGSVRAAEGRAARCRLHPDFADRLLADIARRLPGRPPLRIAG